MTTNTVMAAALSAGVEMSSVRTIRGYGLVVMAQDISHPCGHRESMTLDAPRLASAHEVKEQIAFERGRDCVRCRERSTR